MKECVEPYEEAKRKGIKRVGQKGRARKVNQQLENSHIGAFEYAKVVGVLWPVQKYTEKWGTPKSKKSIGVHVINGQMVRGIVMNSSHGNLDGTYLMKTSSTAQVSSSTKRDRADDLKNETEDLFEKSLERMRVDPKASGRA